MKVKTVLAVFLMLALATSSLIASGQQAVEKSGAGEKPAVTLRFATQSMTDRTGAVTKGILSAFMAKNPNVTIVTEEYPGNDLITAINTAVMADNTPDVFTFWRPESGWNVPSYAKAGAIADLTVLSASPALKDLFPEFAMRTAKQIGGIVYCIPRTSYYDEFVVNKTLFDKNGIPLPTTWDSLVSAITALNAKGIIPWVNTTGPLLDDSSRLFFNILNRVVGNERALKLLGGTESWLSPDVLPALDYFVTVAANNGPPDQSVLSTAQVIAKYLNTGAAGMVLNNNGQINSNVSSDAMPGMVALAFPMTPMGVEKTSSTEADVTNLVYASAKAYRNPAKKAYIDELIIRLVDKDAAKAYIEQAALTVPQLGVNVNKSLVPKFVTDADAIAQKQTGNKWLLSFVSADNRSTFRDVINNVWYGKLNAQQVADALQKGLFGKPN
jgi:raffinose/stachyose/melibiose transport system substrate-binding protein